MDKVIKWVQTPPTCKDCKYRDKKGKRCKLEYQCPYKARKSFRGECEVR